MKIVVIGAGIGGLSTAALLAKQGFEVTVVEKNSTLGGRAMSFSAKGFTWDAGPSWYLMPEIIENYLKNFGKKVNDFYNLKKLNPSYRVFFSDNTHYDIRPKINKNIKTFELLESGSAKKIAKYLKLSKFLYDKSLRDFIYQDFKLSIKNLYLYIIFFRLRLFQNLGKYITNYIKSPKLQKIFLFNLVFLGLSPKNAPAIYSLLSHIDFNLGTWYPLGGMNKIVKMFYTLCKKYKVKIYLNNEVKKVSISDDKISAVHTTKRIFYPDIVINTSDYAYFETKIIPSNYQTYPSKYWAKKTFAPSALLIFLGLKSKIKGLCHHNLFLEENWDKHFDSMYESTRDLTVGVSSLERTASDISKPTTLQSGFSGDKNPLLPKNPNIYICCPTKSDISIAPKKSEILTLLIPLSVNLKTTKKTISNYTENIIEKISLTLKTNISDLIIYKKIFYHNDFKKEFNSFNGTAFGLSHTLFQSLFFRPSHKSKKLKNLYYTGQYTHPGIGIPMVIISSQIVAKKITKDYEKYL